MHLLPHHLSTVNSMDSECCYGNQSWRRECWGNQPSGHRGHQGAAGRLSSSYTLLCISCLEGNDSAKFIYLYCKNSCYRILKTSFCGGFRLLVCIWVNNRVSQARFLLLEEASQIILLKTEHSCRNNVIIFENLLQR